MKRKILTLAAAMPLLALVGCTTAPTTAAPVVQADRSVAASLRSSLEDGVDQGRIPGAHVIIAREGDRLIDVTVGYADVSSRTPLREDSIFRLYSMSKPITSVAIMMLAEQGKLSLDDPAEKYLPEWHDMRVYVSGGLDDMVTEPVARPITIADLLTHTSGITYHFTGDTPVHQYYRKYGVMRDTPVGRTPQDGPPARNLDELVERLGKAPMLHQPGEEFAYSYSTTVLGAIVERVSGERLDRFLEAHLFGPLGMTDTGFFISDAALARFTTLYSESPEGLTVTEIPANSDYRDTSRLLDGGGAIAGTAGDYLRFAQMLANGGTLDGTRFLREASVDAMFTPHVMIAGFGPDPIPFGYGFALGDAASDAAGGLPEGTASWSGSGNTYFFVDREHRAVALAMTHFLGAGPSQKLVRDAVDNAYRQLIGS